jgi:16S rRNA (cytosine1402-N4)-methyltransferase
MSAHQSVLLDESIDALAIKADGIYVDGTFGRGGHSQAILSHLNAHGTLIAIDKDLDAVAHARSCWGDDPRVHIIHGSFARLRVDATEQKILGKVNGILLDLGVSSPQLDNSERGFSFMHDGPLDMRMDSSQALSAQQFINESPAAQMAEIFKAYGEERFSGRIAKAIVAARTIAPITSTLKLAEIVKEANPKWEKHKHPATRVFQAIRIHVNQELDDLHLFLKDSLEVLAPGGRLVIISFHSLEDRIVKQFMRHQELGEQLPIEVPIRFAETKTNFKRVGKPVMPHEREVTNNVRARSAVLRIGEKLA